MNTYNNNKGQATIVQQNIRCKHKIQTAHVCIFIVYAIGGWETWLWKNTFLHAWCIIETDNLYLTYTQYTRFTGRQSSSRDENFQRVGRDFILYREFKAEFASSCVCVIRVRNCVVFGNIAVVVFVILIARVGNIFYSSSITLHLKWIFTLCMVSKLEFMYCLCNVYIYICRCVNYVHAAKLKQGFILT